MKTDDIDNFKDWWVVLEKLREMKTASALDECQHSLARILKYRDNWRLRETVLEYATDIHKPTNEFLEAICAIMTDDNIYISARILAVEALRVLVPRKIKQSTAYPTFRGVSVPRVLKNILDFPQVPMFHDAIARALKDIDQEAY